MKDPMAAQQAANYQTEGDCRLVTLRKLAAQHGLTAKFEEMVQKHLNNTLIDSSQSLGFDLRKMIERKARDEELTRKRSADSNYKPRRRFVPQGAWFTEKGK